LAPTSSTSSSSSQCPRPAPSPALYAHVACSYPTDNCAAQFHGPNPKKPQDQLPLYLSHQAGQSIVKPYLNSTLIAQQRNKPFIMFETNTASCGGVRPCSLQAALSSC
jgi:hypothetical protein